MTVRMISRKFIAGWVKIKMIDGSTLKGKINLYDEEFTANRISDLFTKSKSDFVVISGATVEGKTDQIVVINKRNIIWVSPEDSLDNDNR